MEQNFEWLEYNLLEERHTDHWLCFVEQYQDIALHTIVVLFPAKKMTIRDQFCIHVMTTIDSTPPCIVHDFNVQSKIRDTYLEIIFGSDTPQYEQNSVVKISSTGSREWKAT